MYVYVFNSDYNWIGNQATIASMAAFVDALYDSEAASIQSSSDVDAEHSSNTMTSSVHQLHENVRISEVALDNVQTAVAAQRRRLLLAMMVPEVSNNRNTSDKREDRGEPTELIYISEPCFALPVGDSGRGRQVDRRL